MAFGLKPRSTSPSVATTSNIPASCGVEELLTRTSLLGTLEPSVPLTPPSICTSTSGRLLSKIAELGGRGGTGCNGAPGAEPAWEGVSGVGGFVLGEIGGKMLAKNSAGLRTGLRGLRPIGLLPLLLRTSSEGKGLRGRRSIGISKAPSGMRSGSILLPVGVLPRDRPPNFELVPFRIRPAREGLPKVLCKLSEVASDAGDGEVPHRMRKVPGDGMLEESSDIKGLECLRIGWSEFLLSLNKGLE